ncbi:MAG TPA: S-layer homology domain-containing protein [Candidatus Tyrphobacter sp.]
MNGVASTPFIDQLAQLQIFWPAGGSFEPGKPVLRREFVRWLMRADSAIWAIDPSKQIRPALAGSRAYFSDVPVTDPDFGAIEGMHDAGIAIGFPDKTFRPDRPITREEALTIKAYVDCGAPDPMLADDLGQAYYELPAWRDKHAISHAYVAAIASCLLQDQGTTGTNQLDTIGRTFGAIVTLDPKRPLNRAEAAAMIWKIGEQKPDLNNFPPRTAADALGPSPTPQPT